MSKYEYIKSAIIMFGTFFLAAGAEGWATLILG